ncbi:MAG: T9SS type A sorting domain-containing protein [Bacteroidia bacterium]|jgi:hypothetical protein
MNTYIKTTFLFGATLLGSLAHANAQISDSGFEQWDSVETNGFKNFLPAGWFDITNVVCDMESQPWAVTRTTDAYKGMYAIQLKNIELSLSQPAILFSSAGYSDQINNKIPVSARYTSLNGFYKYIPAAADTFSIMVLMFKGEDMIGFGEFRSSQQTNDYTALHMPVLYTAAASVVPDSAVIMIYAGSSDHFVANTTLLLDEVEFGMTSGLSREFGDLDAKLVLSPNPATNHVNLEILGAEKGKMFVELYSITGSLIKRMEVEIGNEKQEVRLDLTEIPKGLLFVSVTDQIHTKSIKLLHQ